MNSMSLHNLRECYELAINQINDEAAKIILRQRAKRIDIQDDMDSEQIHITFPKTNKQILEEAITELSFDDNSVNTWSLPASGEKEYISALLILRNGTGETNRIEALKHLTVALSYEPDDPRFIALARLLEEVE